MRAASNQVRERQGKKSFGEGGCTSEIPQVGNSQLGLRLSEELLGSPNVPTHPVASRRTTLIIPVSFNTPFKEGVPWWLRKRLLESTK